ncbi:MAG: elongator complex protein 3 [Patescibacteria group bacterium]
MKKRFDYTDHLDQVVAVLKEIERLSVLSSKKLAQLTKKYPLKNGSILSKTHLIEAYRGLAGQHGLAAFDQQIVRKIMMKPVRTLSGVAPITVLTKPFPCPGKCIFCPSDIRMPKSYLSDEPGAQRAERNYFDPYLQTYNRLDALWSMGHSVDKAELIILGGTWSYYPESYQIWFIKECFRALNDFGHRDDREKIRQEYKKIQQQLEQNSYLVLSDDPKTNKDRFAAVQFNSGNLTKKYNQTVSEVYVAPERKLGLDKLQAATWDELFVEHQKNETAEIRNVGLVVETRPDNISEQEVIRIRKLGCTKTQIGVQSTNDDVLEKNHRGHDVAASKRAFKLLRQAGFKIHAHWMANLYGSGHDQDQQDFDQLFKSPAFNPDELKVYPCSLIDSAELMSYYKQGLWKPYSHQELLAVLEHVLQTTPPYCRLTRIIRDIPSQDIVVGNKKTNFRQIAEQTIEKKGIISHDIRAREIRGQNFDPLAAKLKIEKYQTAISGEEFLQYVVDTADGEKLLAFLRLSFPKENFIAELSESAIIREIHVYGRALKIGSKSKIAAQHFGFGTKLINEARRRAKNNGYKKLAVISAIGTRGYYRKKGFSDGELYQYMKLV